MADQQGIGGVPLPPGYVLVEKLGSGGFATVWLAEQGRLGRRVAVKVLGETLDDSERERRFLAECRAIGRLSGHPAVVTVHDAGTTESGHPYLVMEHLPGGSLHDRLVRTGPLPWPEVLDVGVHVADALAAAHDAGILHRDVKPANVLLDGNGSPKLGDFGIARLAEGTNTATGLLVGTIPYTPPEVLSGHRPGPHADVWALGATLHALLAGRSPFSGDHDEPPAAAIARVLRAEAPPLGPDVPLALRELIGRMLRPEPSERPDGCAEVVARLQAIQAERGLPVTPARSTRARGPVTPTGADGATVVGMPAITGTPPPPPPPPPPSPTGPLADAPTELRPAPAAAAAEAAPPAPPPPPTPSSPFDAATTVAPAASEAPPAPAGGAPAGPAAPATTVLPPSAADGAASAPPAGGPGPGGTPPPAAVPPTYPTPPPPPPGHREGRGRGPVLVGVAVVVVLLLAVAAAVVLLGGGDGDDDTAADGTTEQPAGDDTGGATPSGAGTQQLAGPFGAPIDVPTGTATAPAGGWDVEAGCGESACAVRAEGGAAILARSHADGTGAGTLTRVEPDGSEAWSTPLSGLAGSPAIGQVNGTVLVATSDQDNRTYRAYDPTTGDQVWEIQLEQALRPILVPEQVSERYIVILLGAADGYVVVDSESGAVQRGEGLVLASDRGQVYVDRRGVVAARAIGGDQATDLWERPGVDSITEPGVFPAWRGGTIAGGYVVVATASRVVGLVPDSGAEAWSVDVSGDGVDLGTPVAVSAVSDELVVVAAELGDLAVEVGAEPRARWRQARARLVLAPGLDDDRIEAAQGTPIWAATADRLVVGQTGDTVLSIDLADGSVAGVLTMDPALGRSTYALFADGVAVLQGGVVTAVGFADLQELWTDGSHPEATGLAAVDGGVAVVDPTGLHGLTAS